MFVRLIVYSRRSIDSLSLESPRAKKLPDNRLAPKKGSFKIFKSRKFRSHRNSRTRHYFRNTLSRRCKKPHPEAINPPWACLLPRYFPTASDDMIYFSCAIKVELHVERAQINRGGERAMMSHARRDFFFFFARAHRRFFTPRDRSIYFSFFFLHRDKGHKQCCRVCIERRVNALAYDFEVVQLWLLLSVVQIQVLRDRAVAGSSSQPDLSITLLFYVFR